jgi:hypothetical protein
MLLGIAACFRYLARVWATAGPEQCFALLPVNAPPSEAHITTSLSSFSIRLSFHPPFVSFVILYSFASSFPIASLVIVCPLFSGHDPVNY